MGSGQDIDPPKNKRESKRKRKCTFCVKGRIIADVSNNSNSIIADVRKINVANPKMFMVLLHLIASSELAT